jgi:predicted membrane channel-forming protein YqfA (hemolysin III family)
LSGIAPATHYGIVNGWEKSLEEVAIGWLILMGSLYITGALFYAMRIPERFFPGKLDIWVQLLLSIIEMKIRIKKWISLLVYFSKSLNRYLFL